MIIMPSRATQVQHLETLHLPEDFEVASVECAASLQQLPTIKALSRVSTSADGCRSLPAQLTHLQMDPGSEGQPLQASFGWSRACLSPQDVLISQDPASHGVRRRNLLSSGCMTNA